MTPPRSPAADRRRHPRVPIDALADVMVAEGQWMGAYTVENLSAGGGLFVGAPGIEVGERIKLTIRLPAGPVKVVGEVVRIEDRGPERQGVAVAFRNPRPDAEDAIHAAVLAVLESGVGVLQ